MAQEKLKLPRSSYDELRKIIVAYGRHREPASLDDIATLSGVGKTVISDNNAFLIYCSIISSGQKKGITQLGSSLAAALEHDIGTEVARAWRAVVEEAEFLSKMNVAVRVRRTIEESNFVSHIAFSAGEKRSSPVITGARSVVDILRAARLIEERDGVLVPSDAEIPSVPSDTEPPKEGKGTPDQFSAVPETGIQGSGLAVVVQVRVNASVDELPEVAKQLRLLMQELAQPEPKTAEDGQAME